MKMYETPSIQVVEYKSVDIVTASSGSFMNGWLDPLGL